MDVFDTFAYRSISVHGLGPAIVRPRTTTGRLKWPEAEQAQFRHQHFYLSRFWHFSQRTLVNFAALLGWSHQQKIDVMDLEELEKLFDLKITKGKHYGLVR